MGYGVWFFETPLTPPPPSLFLVAAAARFGTEREGGVEVYR